MKISGKRLLSDLNSLKSFTDTPGGGVTRFSYGNSDAGARRFIIESAEACGFTVRTDPVGNMYIRLPGSDEKADRICIGSHIDTVRNGGWLDGIYGVVSGLEVLRTLAGNGSCLALQVEVVIFAEEEGSNFGSTMTGSKFVVGIYGENDLDRLKNDEGIPLRELLRRSGCPPYCQEEVLWDFSKVRAMLELHIEQGPILEKEGKPVGIVESVYGMTTMEVSITGTGNHAGATPMKYRSDAMAAAAQCISEIERIAKKDLEGIVVATVGKVTVSPNCSNVIPEKVVFTFEVREKREDRIQNSVHEIEEAIDRYKLDSIQLHGDETPEFCYYFRGKAEVIKTILIRDKSSFETTRLYHDACDLFLFDTHSENYGGTGRTFNWQWLDAYTTEKPFYLSGGIGLENFGEILKINHPALTGIDVNSKFEIRPGIKDVEKIKQLIALMKG